VVHRFSTLARGFYRDLQNLFQPRLAGEIRKSPRTQPGFELPFLFAPRR
jgi:hypothetical protein